MDYNDAISAEEGLEINQQMLRNARVGKDQSYDVLILQAMTGARIQEIAGLRGCDFVKRRVGDKDYYCIKITAWEERGHGALGTREGLKTVQSDRFIPLPDCGKVLWSRYENPSNKDGAFPQERPRSYRQPWGERLMKRMQENARDLKQNHGGKQLSTTLETLVFHTVQLRW